MTPEEVRISKFLSLVLRHRPQVLGLELDEAGWVDIEDLLEACAINGQSISRAQLESVVKNNPKQRFAFNEDNSRIRASQGHSVQVDLGLICQTPPERLFHGTASRFIGSIRSTGLMKKSRQHVHLSADSEVAFSVGQRHGKPVVLEIRAQKMHEHGHRFFLSENGVWLTDTVPAEYIRFPENLEFTEKLEEPEQPDP